MGLLKKIKNMVKGEKEEYWFVPESQGNSAKTNKKINKQSGNSKTASRAKSKNTSKSESQSKSQIASKTDVKIKADKKNLKPAKADELNSAPAKNPTSDSAAKAAVKKTKGTAAEKSSALSAKRINENKRQPNIEEIANKKSAAKIAEGSGSSKIVTITTKETLPSSFFYDEDEADRFAKSAGEETGSSNAFGGLFKIKKSKDERFVFNLYAANHVIIATSQIYTSSQAAVNGIKSVIANAERANVEDGTLKEIQQSGFPKWEIYIDKAGQYRFRLRATNGYCICHSQGYTAKSSCKNGIESIKKTVKTATVDKSYLK